MCTDRGFDLGKYPDDLGRIDAHPQLTRDLCCGKKPAHRLAAIRTLFDHHGMLPSCRL